MRKVLRVVFSFVAFFTFAVVSTGGAATVDTNGTVVVGGGTVTPNSGSGDYGLLN